MTEQRPERLSEANDGFSDAASRPQVGVVKEFYLFLRDSKRWWLTPIVIVLLLVGGLLLLGGTAAAPFIYTIF